jgi:hypothetical protein
MYPVSTDLSRASVLYNKSPHPVWFGLVCTSLTSIRSSRAWLLFLGRADAPVVRCWLNIEWVGCVSITTPHARSELGNGPPPKKARKRKAKPSAPNRRPVQNPGKSRILICRLRLGLLSTGTRWNRGAIHGALYLSPLVLSVFSGPFQGAVPPYPDSIFAAINPLRLHWSSLHSSNGLV